jgi:enterochelin esterase-like enzyme
MVAAMDDTSAGTESVHPGSARPAERTLRGTACATQPCLDVVPPSHRRGAVLLIAICLVTVGCDAATAPPQSSASALPQRAGPITGPGCTETTGRTEHVEFDSSSFGEVGDFQVYVPPCYDADAARRYPVVYLLHGAGHDDEYWLEVGVVGAADTEIAARRIDPVILVLPDGGKRFTGAEGEVPFERFLSRELVPRVDSGWRTQADQAHRAIGGISLGGAEALEAAADLPRLFAAVGGHSAVVHDAAYLADAFERAGTVVYLDVGAQDSLRPSDEALSAALDERDVRHVFRVSPGGHVEDYWRGWVTEYLRFYDAALSSG